jgi:hypothetical protein
LVNNHVNVKNMWETCYIPEKWYFKKIFSVCTLFKDFNNLLPLDVDNGRKYQGWEK